MSHFFPFLLFSLAVSSAASLATTTVPPDGITSGAQNELTSCLSCRLKVETFAVCLQGDRASLTAQDLTSGDLAPSQFDQVKLESFLVTAAGSRNSVLDISIVGPALERWSRTYYGQEKEFVSTLLNHVNMGTNTISPAMLFEQALAACNSVNPAVLQDPLCAAIVVHNVLNAFGFPDDFRDPTNTDSSTDYFPPWYQQKTPADLTLKRVQLEAAIFPLKSSSGALKWSEWVDVFAVLAYGIETATQLMVNNAQDNFSIPDAQYSAAMEKLITLLLSPLRTAGESYPTVEYRASMREIFQDTAKIALTFMTLSSLRANNAGGSQYVFDVDTCAAVSGYVVLPSMR